MILMVIAVALALQLIGYRVLDKYGYNNFKVAVLVIALIGHIGWFPRIMIR